MILKGISIAPKPRTTKGYNGTNNKFYQSKEWRAFRHSYLILHPLCVICNDNGRTSQATVVDHIRPIRQGGSTWSEDNLQGLCKSCNAVKTALDNPNNQ